MKMIKITIETTKIRQVIDITDLINEQLRKENFKEGIINLFLTHTTAVLTTADLDPGTDLDYLDAFSEMIPKLNYRHPHDPSHVPSHILSLLIGTSLNIPVEASKLTLGTWQRVVLIELDGPKMRGIVITLI